MLLDACVLYHDLLYISIKQIHNQTHHVPYAWIISKSSDSHTDRTVLPVYYVFQYFSFAVQICMFRTVSSKLFPKLTPFFVIIFHCYRLIFFVFIFIIVHNNTFLKFFYLGIQRETFFHPKVLWFLCSKRKAFHLFNSQLIKPEEIVSP